ncbi:MAG: aldo/keto reductase [Eggerthellaceae bacterium]|nr:aldo/keto reductase [Eggerthellaceae bacterium]
MQYFEFKGKKLSALGFGAMRLPVIDGDDTKIDEATTKDMVAYAFDHGINYFDTAWGYHGGNSELVMGQTLSAYPRDSFFLATKFPGYDVGNFGKHEEIFERQLEKCQVDYFDFYLMHNVCELNIDSYLDDETFGTVSYFKVQRNAGRIKHLGFSTHGTYETFMRFMDAYGDDMEFCQIQLNYMDWEFQNAKAKAAYLHERGIAVLVMEPLRGGNLITLSDEDMATLEATRPGKSAVDWALKWVAGVPGVMTVLSGMSTPEQLRENIEIFSTEDSLTEDERGMLESIGNAMAKSKGVPCTACHYCTSHCPIELDIPRLLELYNEHLSRPGMKFWAPMAIAAMPEDKRPAACIAGGSCTKVCPQQIAIPDALADFAAQLAEG